MKKIFLFLLLLVAGASSYAQKSYINLYATQLSNQTNQYCYLTGDIPEGMSSYIADKVGNILNLLAQEGYEVEFMSSSATSINASSFITTVNYLLSKKTSSTNPDNPDIVTHQRDLADDTEAYEVARFNLQGLPVNKDEKGVQIVVYSNYTTKTIIVE